MLLNTNISYMLKTNYHMNTMSCCLIQILVICSRQIITIILTSISMCCYFTFTFFNLPIILNYTSRHSFTTQHHMCGRGLVGNTARDTPPTRYTRRPRPTLGLYNLLQEPLCRSTHPPTGVGQPYPIQRPPALRL